MTLLELVTGTSSVAVAVGWPVSDTDTGAECDRAPIVCPIVVVLPDN